ncbi:hypothetical protein B0H14DRAFT_2654839 [Mycena olivaceomarginata]|nr:hypothetical protein B0H14DRAFT_2654839 [Mycena olivaceomarginata]
MSIIWIAACVYFAWSPDLACAGLLVVCGAVGWITIFIHAPYVCASAGMRTTRTEASNERGGGGREEKIHPARVSTFTAAGKDTSSAGNWGSAGRYGDPQERRRAKSAAMPWRVRTAVPWLANDGRIDPHARGEGEGEGTSGDVERGAWIRPNARDGTGDHDTHKGGEKGRGRTQEAGEGEAAAGPAPAAAIGVIESATRKKGNIPGSVRTAFPLVTNYGQVTHAQGRAKAEGEGAEGRFGPSHKLAEGRYGCATRKCSEGDDVAQPRGDTGENSHSVEGCK